MDIQEFISIFPVLLVIGLFVCFVVALIRFLDRY